MTYNIEAIEKYILFRIDADKFKEQTKEALSYNGIQEEILATLKTINKDKSLNEALEAEKLLLSSELVKSQVHENSIKAAQKQFDEGQKSLKIIENKQAYSNAYETYTEKTKDKQGLPKDSFRQFLDSHITRLNNKLTSPLAGVDVQILMQRKENLQSSKQIYIEMQKEALQEHKSITITPENKEKATEFRTAKNYDKLVEKYPDLQDTVSSLYKAQQSISHLPDKLKDATNKHFVEFYANKIEQNEHIKTAPEQKPEPKNNKTKTKDIDLDY